MARMTTGDITGLTTTEDSIHCRIGTSDVCEEISRPCDSQNKREQKGVLDLHLKRLLVRGTGGPLYLPGRRGIKRAKIYATHVACGSSNQTVRVRRAQEEVSPGNSGSHKLAVNVR